MPFNALPPYQFDARLLPTDSTQPLWQEEDALLEQLLSLTYANGFTPEQQHILQQTYAYGRYYHWPQRRKSGENYITHPVSVALILADTHADLPTLQAAILHDVLEDTPAPADELKKHFGEEVLRLVQGVTKLGKYKFQSKEEQQAENFRNMFLAMAEDVRVIILKLADRLHNMRTMEAMRPDKQIRIANETIEVFAPLANRIGMGNLKAELEDLSLQFVAPEAYQHIHQSLEEAAAEREAVIQLMTDVVGAELAERGIQYKVYGRVKNYYSIYKKMQSQQKEIHEIFDISALRVIVDTEPLCYEVLGVMHHMFTPVAGRFKDFIAMPKSNFYQSLHTTLIGPNKRPVEVQIRTKRMHDVAEYGIAAHVHYKKHGNTAKAYRGSEVDEKLAWLKQIVETHQSSHSAQEFVENVKLDLFPDQVFVFTPKGTVVSLPRGASPIDFAFRIHTEVGYQCAGAIVNEKMIPLDTELQNGDIVEIITNKKSTPRLDWINLCATQHAKGRIRQWYKKHYRGQHEVQGRQLLEADLTRATVDALVKQGVLLDVARELGCLSVDDLYASLGYGEFSLPKVVNRLKKLKELAQAASSTAGGSTAQEANTAEVTLAKEEALNDHLEQKNRAGLEASSLKQLKGMPYNIAKCCMPVPGDNITGVVTRSRGVMIHRDDCVNILQANPNRIMHLTWDGAIEMKQSLHQVLVEAQVMDRVGVLKDMLLRIAERNINVTAVKTTRQDDGNISDVELGLEIKNLEELERLLTDLRQLPEMVALKRSHYRLNNPH
ncbi:MAG: RelA/SpoT family protein [Vampirovibrionales bacterium]